MKYFAGTINLAFLSSCRMLIMLIFISLISACDSIGELDPHEHIERARAFIASGEINSSIIELKSALQKDAGIAEARWLLGVSYLMLANGTAAYDEIEKAETLGYEDSDLIPKKIEALIYSGKYQKAIDITSEIIIENRASDKIFSLRGDAYYELKRYEDAISSYERAIAADSRSVEGRVGLARIMILQNELYDARKHLNEAKDIRPGKVKIWILLGHVELAEGNFVAAEGAFKRATTIANYNAIAHLGLARALLMQNKKEPAKEAINEVLKRYPRQLSARYLLAYISFENGDRVDAIDRIRNILKDVPDHPESLLLLGNILYEDGKIEESISSLSLFLGIVPKHMQAIKLLALIHLEQNEPERAIKVIGEVSSAFKGDYQLLSLLGSAYMASGNLEKGTELLEESIRLNPEAANIRTQLAIGHLSSGSTGKAKDELQTAIKLDPSLIRADILLVLAYLKDKEYDSAIKAAGEFFDRHPGSPLPLNLLGSVYMGQGENDLARQQFEKALMLRPSFTPAIANIAQLDLVEGNQVNAENLYLQILNIDENNLTALINLAKFESQRGDTEQMSALLQRARIGNTSAPLPRVLLTLYYDRTNDAVNMLELITEAADLIPDNSDVIYLLGRAQRRNGYFEKALKTLNQLLVIDPDSIKVLLEVTQVQLITRDITAARMNLDRILSLDPSNRGALIGQVALNVYEKQFEDARQVLVKFIEYYPDSNDINVLGADIAIAEGKITEAIKLYEVALSNNEEQVILIKLVRAYMRNRERSKAKSILNDWIEKYPDDTEINMLSASSYYQEENFVQAIKLYQQILEKNPINMIALNNLAWLYLIQDNPGALNMAKRAYDLSPEQSEVVDTYGWILVKQDQVEQGLQLLKFASVTMIPESPDIRYHVATALAKTDDTEAAIRELQYILDKYDSFSERKDAKELLSNLQ